MSHPDRLLTPDNCVFAFIDYQPEQFRGVSSKDKLDLMLNVLALARVARDFKIPTVLSTVAVKMGVNQPTETELKKFLPPDIQEIDRTSMNSWEDEAFVQAIRATGRRKIVMAGLWTEVCVAFPTLDALSDGYEVFPVIDAIGGVTAEAHQTAVLRMIQAGAQPVTTLALACELQRDWARGNGDTLRTIMRWYFERLRGLKARESGVRLNHQVATAQTSPPH